MMQFLLLFEEWQLTEEKALRAQDDLCCAIDAYRAGMALAPSRQAITHVRRLRALARQRLRELMDFVDSERTKVSVI